MIYHYKMELPHSSGGGGDGTKSNPWYWYQKTSGTSIQLNNNSVLEDNGRLYIRVKLLAGVTYYIGETSPGGGDGKIWLYDQNGNELIDNDDADGEISGEYVTDHFGYTPSSTGIYIIGAGAYSGSRGDYIVVISQLPESDPVPVSGLIYETSQGFSLFGKAIKYVSANLADCGLIPKNGLIFYASLNGKHPSVAQTGQTFSSYGNNVTYQKIKNIDCGYFSGSRLSTSEIVNWGDVTLSAWLYAVNNGGYTSALHIGADSSNQMFKIGGLYENDFVSRHSTVDVTTNVNISDDFHHLLATYNGNIIYFYVDGILKTTINNSGSITASYITIGSDNNNSYQFNGYIAQCRIYNRVLSANEVMSLYSQLLYYKNKSNSSSSTSSSSSSQSSHLVFYAPLSSEVNTTQTGQTITENGDVTYSTINGIPCAYFDGSSYLSGSETILSGHAPFTISLWAKSNTTQTIHWAFCVGSSGENHAVMMGIRYAGEFAFMCYANDDSNSGISVDTVWHNFVFTYNGSIGTTYVDGIQRRQFEFGQIDIQSSWKIGAIPWANQNWNGYVSSVRVYDEVISASQIAELASEFNVSESSSSSSQEQQSSSSSSPSSSGDTVLLMHFNGDLNIQGNYAFGGILAERADSRDVEYGMQFIENWSSPSYDTGKFGNALVLDGSNKNQQQPQYEYWDNHQITLPVGSNILTNDFTIEFFYKTTEGYDNSGLILSATADYIIEFGARGSGASQTIDVNIGNGSNWMSSTTINSISSTANQWHHVAFVRSSDTCVVYIDGQPYKSFNVSSLTSTSNAVLCIGNIHNRFSGMVEQFMISSTARYNVAFTPPTSPFTASSSSLNTLLLMHFNDNLTQEGLINSGIVSTKTIHSMDAQWGGSSPDNWTPTYGTGKFGNALYFNGTNEAEEPQWDYYGMYHKMTLPIGGKFLTSDFTVQFWYKLLTGRDSGSTIIGKYNSANLIEFVARGGGNTHVCDVRIGNGTSWVVDYGGSPSPSFQPTFNEWHHVALVRYNNVFTCYIDGAVYYTSNSISSLTSISKDQFITLGSLNSMLDGYIDELRISSTARYTSTFTPPASPFTMIAVPIYTFPLYVVSGGMISSGDFIINEETGQEQWVDTFDNSVNGHYQLNGQNSWCGTPLYVNENGYYLYYNNNNERIEISRYNEDGPSVFYQSGNSWYAQDAGMNPTSPTVTYYATYQDYIQ